MPTQNINPSDVPPPLFYLDAANNAIEPAVYERITVKTSDLFREFPHKSELTGQSKDQSSTHEKDGRPPKYDWEAFYRQIVLIAQHPDGLPDTQAELEEKMAKWCENNWPVCPGESSIKAKIKPIYQHLK